MGVTLFLAKEYNVVNTDVISLVLAVIIGSFVYGLVTITLWFLLGKPKGIESNIVNKSIGLYQQKFK